MVSQKNTLPPRKEEVLMQKIIPVRCSKCNNSTKLYKYGKDTLGNQKYKCRICKYQFAPDYVYLGRKGRSGAKPLPPDKRKYPSCPKCNHATYVNHDYEFHTHYKCCNRKCNHIFIVVKPMAIPPSSASKAHTTGLRYRSLEQTALIRRATFVYFSQSSR